MSDKKPGPELDAVISNVVMGNRGRFVKAVKINDKWIEQKTWLPVDFSPESPPGGWYASRMPICYSQEVSVAWGIVEKLNHDRHDIIIEVSGNGSIQISVGWIDKSGWSQVRHATSNTLPHAICMVALEVYE